MSELGTAAYIAVAGTIAAGKTSVARALASRIPCAIVLEDYLANPFLSSFAKAPAQNALETEITFLMLHYHQLRSAIEDRVGLVVADFYLGQDLWYARMNLDEEEFTAFKAVWELLTKRLPSPRVVVALHASPELVLRRVDERGRILEGPLTDQYFRDITLEVERGIRDIPAHRLVELDMNQIDVVHADSDADLVAGKVATALHG